MRCSGASFTAFTVNSNDVVSVADPSLTTTIRIELPFQLSSNEIDNVSVLTAAITALVSAVAVNVNASSSISLAVRTISIVASSSIVVSANTDY